MRAQSRATMDRLAAFLLAFAAGCGAPQPSVRGGFWFPDEGRVVDLTLRSGDGGGERATTIATAMQDGSIGGTLDQIEPGRCIAPLVVVDVRARAVEAPELVVEVADLVEQEGRRGPIPSGAVVVLATGGARRDVTARGTAPARTVHPGFSPAAVEYLVRERGAIGLGTDAPALDASSAVRPEATRAAVALHAYVLTNLGRLDQVPEGRAIVLLAPPAERLPSAAVRVLALVERTVARGSR